MPRLLNKPIHIFGVGGIGTALGWALAQGGYSVILIDNHSSKIAHGRENGITVVGPGTQQIPIVAFDDWVPPDEGFILLCTKTYDNPAVLALLPDDAFLVPIQNGFDPELEQRDHACEGIASFVSECQRDRPVTRITRPGSLHIGARRSITADEQAEIISLASALGKAKLFPVELVPDIRPYKATKLMYNAAISPLAAMAGVDNGELLTGQLAKALFFALLLENYAILQHAKIPLARIGPFHPDTVSLILRTPWLPALMAMFFRPSLRGTYCSMAPDIHAEHPRTEIDAYTGHLIRLAGKFSCPLNRATFALIQKITSEGLKPQYQHLQDLADNLPEGVLS
ncbi:ketopantoate reductase C-terminal domain-containing protein [Nitrosomonas sp.]|uniref:ketopantoate reductase family protein n=1 Tax=Nitrosomonas sp. TaxID=42353 RepID=UPI0025CEC031|nr:ketopantoate reductase C-terminal domain-containing protein [Nitrosomonas sp.]MBY0482980.1 ketopantoate reductase family protein [Nitrosomonas sp.]